MLIEIRRRVKRIKSGGGGWKELEARTATVSRLAGWSLPILARAVYRRERLRFFQKTRDADKDGREGGNAARERASERVRERRRKASARTERNLKGHPAIHLSMQPLIRRLFVRRDRTNPSGNREFLLSFLLPIRSSNPHR